MIFFIFLLLFTAPQELFAISIEEQLQIIKKDFKSLPHNISNDVYIAYNYITSKKKKQQPLISYVVARKVVEHVLQDRRFENHLTNLGYFALIMGIIQVESGFNPFAVSHKNARGLMQIHIPTWGKYLSAKESHEIQKNIFFGTSILYLYLTQSNGDLINALYKYYGARDPSYSFKVLSAALSFKKYYLANLNNS